MHSVFFMNATRDQSLTRCEHKRITFQDGFVFRFRTHGHPHDLVIYVNCIKWKGVKTHCEHIEIKLFCLRRGQGKQIYQDDCITYSP